MQISPGVQFRERCGEKKKVSFFIAGKWKHKPGEKGRNCKESCFIPLSHILRFCWYQQRVGGPWLGDFYSRPSIILPHRSFSVTSGFAKKCKIIPRLFGKHTIFDLDLQRRAFSFSVLDATDMWGERILSPIYFISPRLLLPPIRRPADRVGGEKGHRRF